MFVEKEFFIGLRDLEKGNKLSNTSLLSFLEDMGGIHSNIAGNGLNDIDKVKHTWILLGWKIELYKRPVYAETIRIKTWSRKMDKFYAFRDFELYNQSNEKIGIATSKWIYVNIETGKITKTNEELENKYQTENISVFENEDLEKLKVPENFENECEYKITKDMIDVNKHVHNIYFLNIAREVIPDSIYENNEFNSFEIMYKKEIKYGENVKCLFTEEEKNYSVIIKDNENNIHAIIQINK